MAKYALVTGASGEIGAAIAKKLHQQGYDLYLQGNKNIAALEEVCDRLGGVALAGDLGDPNAVRKMFEAVEKLDVCVCCAGSSLVGLFDSHSDEQMQKCVNDNLFSTLYTAREALKKMLPRHSGSVVLVSSMWGVIGASCEAVYSACKGAQITLAKALAKEVGPSGIRVNCVAPGLIDTKMNKNLTSEDVQAICEETPLGRVGSVEDVAEVVAFLAGDSASFMTGQTLTVDGGLTL